MKEEEFNQIVHLHGIEFVKTLLSLEERRFEASRLLPRSPVEDINADFGAFPTTRTAPVYFAGDIRDPTEKVVFIGINPGFNAEQYPSELDYLERRGWFEGYCRFFGDYFQGRRIRYYSSIWRFLSRLYSFGAQKVDWDWLQEHFIALELIPYHSKNINGLRINDRQRFRNVHLEILLRLLGLFPLQTPVFINGFPSIRRLLAKDGRPYPEFDDVLQFQQHDSVTTGKIGCYDFVGLPFLGFPRGGRDALVAEIIRLKGVQKLAWPLA